MTDKSSRRTRALLGRSKELATTQKQPNRKIILFLLEMAFFMSENVFVFVLFFVKRSEFV